MSSVMQYSGFPSDTEKTMNMEENTQQTLYLEGDSSITSTRRRESTDRVPLRSELGRDKSTKTSTRRRSIAAAAVKRFVAAKREGVASKVMSCRSSGDKRRTRNAESVITPSNKRLKTSKAPSLTTALACITPSPNANNTCTSNDQSPSDPQKAKNRAAEPNAKRIQRAAPIPTNTCETQNEQIGFEEGSIRVYHQRKNPLDAIVKSGGYGDSDTTTDEATTPACSNKRLKVSTKEEKENEPIPCLASLSSGDSTCTDETPADSQSGQAEQRCSGSAARVPVDDRTSENETGVEEKQSETSTDVQTSETPPEEPSEFAYLIPESMDAILKEHLEEDLPCVADRYDLNKLSILGFGAYGCVYRAVSLTDGQVVALKWVDMASEDDADFAEREIRFLKRVAGLPNVVQFQGEFRTKNGCFIVMELCKGGNLTELMKETHSGVLDERACTPILMDVLKALSMMHKADIIHRDIKPANVMTNGRSATLVDIGFCCGLEEPEYVLTAPVGSLAYGAPEVFDESSPLFGKTYDSKVDMYSVGCTLYFMLNGIDYDSTVPAEDRFDGLSFWAEDLIQNLTHKNPSRRLSADDAIRHPFVAENFLSSLVVTLIRWSKEFCWRIIPYVVIGAALLFALVLLKEP